MSKIWRKLREGYQEIGKLYSDLQPAVFDGQDWKGLVSARESLGSNVQVEASYLAEHFLLAWNDWWGLCQRYLRFFGQPEEKLPRMWRTLGARCQALVDRIVQDPRLDQVVSESWLIPGEERQSTKADNRSARSLFHDHVMNHRRLKLLFALQSPPEKIDGESGAAKYQGKVWPKTCESVLLSNEELRREWNQLSNALRSDTLWFLRNYQHANLAVSWLNYDPNTLAGTAVMNALAKSTFVYALRPEEFMLPSIEQFVQQLINESGELQTVLGVIRRISTAIAEVGYENFLEDVASGDFLGGKDSPIGTAAINLIPGHEKSACFGTLLAVSCGDKKAIGFPSIMKQVREHLIRCMAKTRVVIVLCDHWRSGMLEDHIGDLRAHHDRGVRFLFLMVGTPSRAIAPVAVDLGFKG